MKVFLDTNIILDFYEVRCPFCQDAEQILALAEAGKIELLISPITAVNAYYILRKHSSPMYAAASIKDLTRLCHITDITSSSVSDAIDSEGPDFEDNVQISAAARSGSDMIITRNIRDFAHCSIPVKLPFDFLKAWHSKH